MQLSGIALNVERAARLKLITIWSIAFFPLHSQTRVLLQKGPPRFSEESVLQLERELVQARLKEAESQCALKEMQDKILDMEKVGSHTRF